MLCTLDTLTTCAIIILFFIATGFLATSRMSVPLGFAVGSKLANFHTLCTFLVRFFHMGHRHTDHFNLRVGETFRESDFEHHEEISELEGLFMEWQTLAGHGFNVIGLDDLSRVVFNSDFGAVEMSDNELHSS